MCDRLHRPRLKTSLGKMASGVIYRPRLTLANQPMLLSWLSELQNVNFLHRSNLSNQIVPQEKRVGRNTLKLNEIEMNDQFWVE